MDSISVAPAPTANPPEAPAARSPAEEGSAKPFEQTLKREIAKPAAARAETARAAPAEKAAPATVPVDPAGFAALLESAGLLETEEGHDLADGAELAEGVLLPDTLSAGLPLEANPLPAHALPEALARARAELPGLEGDAAEGGLEPVIRGAPKLALPDARALRERAEEPLEIAGAKTESPDSETLVGAFASERSAIRETPLLSAGSTIDTLGSPAFAPRWMQGQATLAAAAAAAAPAATAHIDTPFGETAWGEAFQQKIVWLVDRQQQRAELHVNPAHLGPVEVMLNLGDDSAAIAFSSPHAAVREAIEASLADLRNALGERGLSLGEARVSADSGTAREQMAEEARNAGRRGRGEGGDAVPTEILPRRVSRGLVDLFA